MAKKSYNPYDGHTYQKLLLSLLLLLLLSLSYKLPKDVKKKTTLFYFLI